MSVYRNIIILLLASIVVVLVLTQILTRLAFDPVPDARLREPADARPARVSLLERRPVPLTGIKNPISPSAAEQAAFPPVPLGEAVRMRDAGKGAIQDRKVSLTLVKDRASMAIIDDRLVHEGESLGRDRVIKIEKDKVLLRDGSRETWLFIE